jgi:hypothetical protein
MNIDINQPSYLATKGIENLTKGFWRPKEFSDHLICVIEKPHKKPLGEHWHGVFMISDSSPYPTRIRKDFGKEEVFEKITGSFTVDLEVN